MAACVTDHLKRMKELVSSIRERLDAKRVARLMFERDALTWEELESIVNSKTPTEAADNLLNIIGHQPERAVYDCFLDTLKQSSQEHIYWLLVDTGCQC